MSATLWQSRFTVDLVGRDAKEQTMDGTRASCAAQWICSISPAVMAALTLVIAGCATPPKVQETKMVWPPPPLTTRIQFVRTITSEKDLTSDTTFTDTLAAFLTGEKLPSGRLAEPGGLRVSDEG